MEPFFSIIIPTYNRAEWIRDTLESVFSQSFTNFEVIVVDDGSTDGTEKKLATIQDPRLRYFRKTNEERSIARNFGIKKAKGSYINFLDSDDYQLPNHLEVAFSIIQNNRFPVIIHLGYKVTDENGRILVYRNNIPDQDLLTKMVHENLFSLNAVFIQQKVALKYQFINSPFAFISEDWFLWMKLLVRFPVVINNTITSVVVEHKQRSLRSIDAEKLIACTELIVKFLKEDKEFTKVLGGRARVFLANQYTFLTLILALSGNKKKETWEYLLKSVREDITVIVRRRFLASIKHLAKSYISLF